MGKLEDDLEASWNADQCIVDSPMEFGPYALRSYEKYLEKTMNLSPLLQATEEHSL